MYMRKGRISINNLYENIGFNILLNKTKHKSCFFDDSECSETIIKAHSIQNNRILNKLSVDGNVIMIDSTKLNNNHMFQMDSVGRKKATTFTGFCSFHDNKIFEPIEGKIYAKGDKEQEFLFAYRALAKEHYAKKNASNFIKLFFDIYKSNNICELEKYFPQIKGNKSYLDNLVNIYTYMLEGYNDALKRYEEYRVSMKININNRKFHSIRTTVIEFPVESRIAVSSLINIEYDVEGNHVNNLRYPKSYISPCFITVFPQDGKTYTLLSYFNKTKKTYEFLENQILNKSIPKQQSILSNMIVMYCENVVFSPALWNSYGKEKQKKYIELFTNTVLEKHKLKAGDFNIFE